MIQEKIWLERVPRFTNTFVFLLVVFTFWVGGIVVVHWYNNTLGSDNQPLILCPLKFSTGVPCPTCGSTRAAVDLATLHPIDAWFSNPLVTIGIPCIGVLLLLRIGFGRVIRIRLTPLLRRFCWIGSILLILSNWVWVILSQQ